MKFNKYFIILLLLKQISLFGQSPEKNAFTLTGNIRGLDTGFITLFYGGINGSVFDTCQVANGKFKFKGFVAEPRIAYLIAFRDKKQYSNDKTKILECFIEPGNLSIDDTLGDFRYMEIQGSASDRDRVKRDKSKKQIMKRIDSVSVSFDECRAEYSKEKMKTNRSDQLKSLMQKCDSLGALLSIRTKNDYDSLDLLDSLFIINNPASYVAAFMLMRKLGDRPTEQFPDIKNLYDRFPPNIKESSYGEDIRTKMKFERNIYVGAEAIDFSAL